MLVEKTCVIFECRRESSPVQWLACLLSSGLFGELSDFSMENFVTASVQSTLGRAYNIHSNVIFKFY